MQTQLVILFALAMAASAAIRRIPGSSIDVQAIVVIPKDYRLGDDMLIVLKKAEVFKQQALRATCRSDGAMLRHESSDIDGIYFFNLEDEFDIAGYVWAGYDPDEQDIDQYSQLIVEQLRTHVT